MYLMGIHGIRDDCVQYTKINRVLHFYHKVFIKKIMCEPQNVTAKDFEELTKL